MYQYDCIVCVYIWRHYWLSISVNYISVIQTARSVPWGSLISDSLLNPANIFHYITVSVIITWTKLIPLLCWFRRSGSSERDFSIASLYPPMEKGGVERSVMAVCIPVGSTWLKELIWPFAISICLGTYWHMCVQGPVCVRVCVFERLWLLPW